MVDANPTIASGIYQIRCLANGKIYIGSAVNIKKRWKLHLYDLANDRHHSSRLQRSWNKYKADQFVFEILEIIADKADLVRTEQRWLDHIRPFDKTIGYNISPTAGSPLGVKHTPETLAKLSAIRKGKSPSIEQRTKISIANKGKIVSPETRAKTSAALKGHPVSPETRAKLSLASKGNRYRRGKTNVRRPSKTQGYFRFE